MSRRTEEQKELPARSHPVALSSSQAFRFRFGLRPVAFSKQPGSETNTELK